MLPNQFTLHHYGFLTRDIDAWLKENELLLGKPFRVYSSVRIDSQMVNIVFVEQTEGAILTELVEPWPENTKLHKWISKGISFYHRGYLAPKNGFDDALAAFEKSGQHALPVFHSEAFNNRRCVFIVTASLGMTEIIEQKL